MKENETETLTPNPLSQNYVANRLVALFCITLFKNYSKTPSKLDFLFTQNTHLELRHNNCVI